MIVHHDSEHDCLTLQLGDRFDIRGFHDAVLDQGALPLDILEKQVKDWIARQKSAPAAPAVH